MVRGDSRTLRGLIPDRLRRAELFRMGRGHPACIMTLDGTGYVVRKALIIAPDQRGLQPLFGIPAVRRLTLLTLQLGLEPIYIARDGSPLSSVLQDLVPQEAFHQVNHPPLLDRVVHGLALSHGERVLVLRADHVVDRLSLTRLLEAGAGTGLYLMKGEGASDAEALYLAGPSDLKPILGALWSCESDALGGLDEARHVRGVAGLPVVMNKEEDKPSEARLTEALALQTQADDGFLARHVDRRLSRLISRRLAHTRITPNQITLGSVIIGLMGAVLLAAGSYWSQLVGSLLFLCCVILDGVDGEVARLKMQETTFGHYLDIITDNMVNLSVFAGIALGLYRDSGHAWYLHALWVLLGGFGLCALAVYQCILRRSPEERERSPKSIRFMALLSNRDFAYLVMSLAVLHRLHWFLVGAAVGTYLFAAALWAMSLYERRASAR